MDAKARQQRRHHIDPGRQQKAHRQPPRQPLRSGQYLLVPADDHNLARGLEGHGRRQWLGHGSFGKQGRHLRPGAIALARPAGALTNVEEGNISIFGHLGKQWCLLCTRHQQRLAAPHRFLKGGKIGTAQRVMQPRRCISFASARDRLAIHRHAAGAIANQHPAPADLHQSVSLVSQPRSLTGVEPEA